MKHYQTLIIEKNKWAIGKDLPQALESYREQYGEHFNFNLILKFEAKSEFNGSDAYVRLDGKGNIEIKACILKKRFDRKKGEDIISFVIRECK